MGAVCGRGATVGTPGCICSWADQVAVGHRSEWGLLRGNEKVAVGRLVAMLKSALRRSGGIGRRKGLKIPRAQKARTGSIPVSGTRVMQRAGFAPKGGRRLFDVQRTE